MCYLLFENVAEYLNNSFNTRVNEKKYCKFYVCIYVCILFQQTSTMNININCCSLKFGTERLLAALKSDLARYRRHTNSNAKVKKLKLVYNRLTEHSSANGALQPWKWCLIGTGYYTVSQVSSAHCPRNGLWTCNNTSRENGNSLRRRNLRYEGYRFPTFLD